MAEGYPQTRLRPMGLRRGTLRRLTQIFKPEVQAESSEENVGFTDPPRWALKILKWLKL